ncbi:LysE family translocator [Dongia deserti]|uniref:LysE family translocator n=1 Tax=Dongia deserti TaxID=2268030 RepID=UPI0013C50566|nr:LysE family translocator [Dongia deserti]
MTLESAIAFAIGMFFLALSPGPGLATIISRAWASGPVAGLAVTAGLVLADFLFMGIAVLGLTAVATALGPLFQIVKYAGAAYLIWLGYRAFRSSGLPLIVRPRSGKGTIKDVGLGFLVTLGNPKAILFYGALLPTFLDMTQIRFADFLILAAIVVLASYVVYGSYIFLAERSRRLLSSTAASRVFHRLSGSVLIGAGVAVAAR